jgi:Na+-transporting NADH:ubiquinone oxidoreductase subunit NqrC
VFTQWLASIALVVANAEMRFLWLALATAILVATVVVSRRQLQAEKALLERTSQNCSGGSTPPGDRHG